MFFSLFNVLVPAATSSRSRVLHVLDASSNSDFATIASVCSFFANASSDVHFCSHVFFFLEIAESSARSLAISASCILPSDDEGLPLLLLFFLAQLEQEHWQVQARVAGDLGDFDCVVSGSTGTGGSVVGVVDLIG